MSREGSQLGGMSAASAFASLLQVSVDSIVVCLLQPSMPQLSSNVVQHLSWYAHQMHGLTFTTVYVCGGGGGGGCHWV